MPLFARKPAKDGVSPMPAENDITPKSKSPTNGNNNNNSTNNNNNSNNTNNNNNNNNNNNSNNYNHSNSKSKNSNHKKNSGSQSNNGVADGPGASKPQLIFHCQLAHGSPTGLITGFASVRELYAKIAECYDIPIEDILFCTLNTHKIDMSKLLGGQIGLDDFIFAHRRGQAKEVEIVKTDSSLGLTITDNGAGYGFIKRIKPDSVIDRIEHIVVGDHIEKLNDVSVVGKRHYEIARLLRDIPTGATFTMRLVEPMRSSFQSIGPRIQSRSGRSSTAYGSGKETLRFKANGSAQVENRFDEATQSGIEAINALLESFMGINDTELATQIWDLAIDKTNSMDFAEAIDGSDLESFGFTDDFVIDLWGAVTDARRRSGT